jgi:hypothetical protein
MSLPLKDPPPSPSPPPVDPKVFRDEEERGVCRVLYQYAIRRSTDSIDEGLSLLGSPVYWYHAGVKDSFLNAVIFLHPEEVEWKTIEYVAYDFLPRHCSVPLYSFSFFAREEHFVTTDSNGSQSEVIRPTNPSIRRAQEVLSAQNDASPIIDSDPPMKWKWTRCPIMVRSLWDIEEDSRVTFVEREELEVVKLNPDMDADSRAFEQICSSAFDYEYSEELIRLHTRCASADPLHCNDLFEKFLLRHKPTGQYVGVISYSHDASQSNQIVTLTELAVHSDHKRMGYGAYMVKYIMRHLWFSERQKYTHLILDATDEGSLLYRKLGFVPVEGYGVYRFFSLGDAEES